MQENITRKIIHIDMDAFFAAVEQRDNPELKGLPLIVGGNPKSRGVVATCSYEARKFGIHSAMSSSRAYNLCPKAIFVRPRMDVYKTVSNQIREIFQLYSDFIEPLSLDEAFLDVTMNKMRLKSATDTARAIKNKIFDETGLTASAGVSYNKFIAKVASDMQKPDGLTVIPPKAGKQFIENLPIKKFFGVGKVTEKKMLRLGIKNGADLKLKTKKFLIGQFGKAGAYYFDIARGIDNRPVNPNRIRKSIGRETTLQTDISDTNKMLGILSKIADQVSAILKRNQKKGSTITLKIRYSDFKTVTRSKSLTKETDKAEIIIECVKDLLKTTEAGSKKVRLLGITLSNFSKNKLVTMTQLEFPF